MAVNLYRHESAGFLGDDVAKPERILALYDCGETIPSGRGTSRVVEIGGRRVILKKEARGGMSAAFLPGGFYSLDLFNAEIEIQEMMHAGGMTFPILARVAFSRGVLWDIYTIVPFIEECLSLRDMIAEGSLVEERVALAGKTVAKMHGFGLYHFDLNCGNVIFTDDGPMVIDFKGSYIYSSPLKRCLAAKNLLRLMRSFHKEAIRAKAAADIEFERFLLEGYAGERDEEWVKELINKPSVSKLRLWSYKVRF